MITLQPAKDTLLLLSGGIDSALVLQKEKHRISRCIWMDYGQPAAKAEEESAKALAELAHVGLVFAGLDIRRSMNDHFCVVPMRNAAMLSVAVNRAAMLGLTRVVYGAIADDAPHYADCTKEFVETFSKMAQAFGVTVEAPLIDMSKSDIVKQISEEYLAQTWSCYRKGPVPCGECGSCVGRENAFHG